MQTYPTGQEVRLGDRVRRKGDVGKIVGVASDLSKWGLSRVQADGKAMIEFKKMGLMCEETADNEDLEFIGRAGV